MRALNWIESEQAIMRAIRDSPLEVVEGHVALDGTLADVAEEIVRQLNRSGYSIVTGDPE